MTDDELSCESCGALLDGDPDDDPTGEAGGPICGECDRARNFDDMLFALDAEDGTLDGNID